MGDQKPTVGRVVHYRLNTFDVEAHSTNGMVAGDICPAIVSRVFDPESTTINLRVLLDGEDVLWRTSVTQGDEPGQWSWPPRS